VSCELSDLDSVLCTTLYFVLRSRVQTTNDSRSAAFPVSGKQTSQPASLLASNGGTERADLQRHFPCPDARHDKVPHVPDSPAPRPDASTLLVTHQRLRSAITELQSSLHSLLLLFHSPWSSIAPSLQSLSHNAPRNYHRLHLPQSLPCY
jgi:hypothetical protein